MRILTLLIILNVLICLPSISHAQNVPEAPNGIAYPQGLTNWRVIGTSLRSDNNTQRVILGNSIAIKAARAKTDKLVWPKGTILAKLVRRAMLPHEIPGLLSP
ncbi:cytochrome P460 family protein [Bathymodiolus japonicus methanotrophic gill symbiont]|uniref:cytochrome P460 family protein n=1 Tax=Bathymodiolus japonicus methanotrophic gill symbiont TaxID=113269 RepID=UPI001C8E7D91|nr:cytochrome P460 family protein [Bathymodiolus japonicus methanotrophic gill symbiont]